MGILLGAAALRVLGLRRLRAQPWRWRWFYAGFIVFCLVCVVEELSWGQRIFGYRSPTLFERHARQRETNLHNLLQRFITIKVKEIALGTFIVYGLVLPVVMRRKPAVRAWIERTGSRVPDTSLWSRGVTARSVTPRVRSVARWLRGGCVGLRAISSPSA